MEQTQLYLYLIEIFGSLALLQFILLMICKRPVFIKLQSMYYRKKGYIKLDHTDAKKACGTYFSNVTDSDTIQFTKNDGTGQLMGIDRRHIYLDTVYDIMALKTNPVGSYQYLGLIKVCTTENCGYEGVLGKTCPKCGKDKLKEVPLGEQSLLSPDHADKLYKKQAMTPEIQNKIEKVLMLILIAAGAACAIGMLNAFLTWDVYNKIKDFTPIITERLVEYMQRVI